MRSSKAHNKRMRQQPFASKPLHEQVEEAFSKATELSGVIHGVRTIHQGTPGRRTGLFPSVKNDAVMATESKLETAHCLDLERMSSLDAYRLQALAVRTSVTSTQYPDALLRWSDGSLGAKEVKPSPQHLTSPKQQAFDRVAAALEIAFITYNVVYAAQLPSGMELWNLKWLYARGNHKNWSNHELEAATRLWKANTSSLTLGELWRQLGAASLDPLIAEYLIFHRVIAADLHKMLGPDSSLSEVSSA